MVCDLPSLLAPFFQTFHYMSKANILTCLLTDTSIYVGQAANAESSGIAADLGIHDEPMSVQELLNMTGIFQDNSHMASGPFFYDWDYIDG